VSTPEQAADRVAEFESSGVDLLLLQSSPQIEEMERYAEELIQPRAKAAAKTA
jgi:FMNH2-dependent dimethyl sulfone monooxygenase